jgi:hypothetical protein
MNDWNESKLREWFNQCPDVVISRHFLANDLSSVLIMYCENLCDLQQINKILMPVLDKITSIHLFSSIPLKMEPYLQPVTAADVSKAIFSGQLFLFSEMENIIFTVNLANVPKRTPEESSLDVSIRGPRDGFVEDFGMNLALIRNRLRTESLVLKQYTIGKRSATKVGLLYLHDVINPAFIEGIRTRLDKIDVDSLVSGGQLEEYIKEPKFTIFPLVLNSGRPDFVVDCLSRGRFVLVIEGMPTVIVAPVNLFLLLKSAEDAHFPAWIAGVGSMLRIIGILISLLLPGFWISLTVFNQDQLPFPLLATITQTRIGLPLPAGMELFLMMCILELFREAGMRLPRAVGQTLAVVGGIVIGDAAIRAALISPSLIVVAALTSVATSTLSNQALAGAVSYLRFLIFCVSSLLGMYGFILSGIYVILHLTTLNSFGLAYLSPLSPFSMRDFWRGVFSTSWRRIWRRPATLNTQDSTRTGHKKL